MKKIALVIFLLLIGYSFNINNNPSSSFSFVSAQPAIDINATLHFIETQYLRLSSFWLLHQQDYPHIGYPLKDWTWEPGYTPFTGGFYTSILWQLYEWTGNQTYKNLADATQVNVAPCANFTNTHDVGFTIYYTFARGYQLTQNPTYLPVVHQAALSLSTRYSPKVGCTRSWDEKNEPLSDFWVIIDNMMNLELFYWAGMEFGNVTWIEMADHHATRTMEEHFREDNSTWHVVEYNETTGGVLRKHTNQGYSDSSMWARGQSWAIYGYTMAYRYTGNELFLGKAAGAADIFLSRLAKEVDDGVPYWDFDCPYNVSYQPRDTSAAAIVASGLFEMSSYPGYERYRDHAIALLVALTKGQYYIQNNPDYGIAAILANGTSNWPQHSGLDSTLIFGDYYYTEAVFRYWKSFNGEELPTYRQHLWAMKQRERLRSQSSASLF